MQQDAADHFKGRDRGFFAGHGAVGRDPEVAALADVRKGAFPAIRVFAADERAEFHERLIEVARPAFGDERLCELPDTALGWLLLDRGVDVEDAGQDTLHVAVHAGHLLIEGRAGDGPGGVGPHAGQSEDVGVAAGENPAVPLHDGTGGSLNVARPAVIAEPFPRLEHVLFRRFGYGGHVWKAFHPAQEVPDPPVHLRLLHHDFRDPRAVGVVVVAPRQGAAVGGEPRQQPFLNKGKASFIVHAKRYPFG